MKTKNLFGILILFLLTFSFISCDKEDEDGRKITDYKEYVLTVASEMKPGVIWSEGNNFLKEVYVVKKENAEDWEAMGYIDGFEFDANGKTIIDSESFRAVNTKYFIAGDVINGGSEIVNAVAEAVMAAEGIHKFLSKETNK